MRTAITVLLASLLSACASSGGDILRPDDRGPTPGKAVIFLTAAIADNTRYQTCSILGGTSAATATWFGWSVTGAEPHLVALEVPVPDYRLIRFGCSYNGVMLSTSLEGPTVNLEAGSVAYLGRLTVSDTEFGSAPGYRKMPSAIRLTFDDQRDSDLRRVGEMFPLIPLQDVVVKLPERWNMQAMNRLRPLNRGLRVVQAPTAGAFSN